MNPWLRRFTLLLALLLVLSLVASWLPTALSPTKSSAEKRARDRRWIDTSHHLWDRLLCRWGSLCGLNHLREDPADLPDAHAHAAADDDDDDEWRDLKRRSSSHPSWLDSRDNEHGPASGAKRDSRARRRIVHDIPDFVFKHAPLVHLYSGESFWPSDIADHIQHMNVTVDNVPIHDHDQLTLSNLDHLNAHEGTVVLHSRDDVESRPSWLHSRHSVPNPLPDAHDGHEPPRLGSDSQDHLESTTWFDVDKAHPLHRLAPPRPPNTAARSRSRPDRHHHPGEPRFSRRGHKPDADGYSRAPAVLVLVDKGSGILDAFWFFFYSYNLGQTVLGIRFGNHVGDWEHCMVRFEHGVPRAIYFSEHEGGQAYAWEAVEKRGARPVIYSAVGSHAMYALPGEHPYVLPFGMLKDVTDKGPLWDPALNNYAYHYDYTLPNDRVDATRDIPSLIPAASNPRAPTSWFHYKGAWGDEVYPLADARQWRLFGQYHYVTGPNGPKFKRLERSKLCGKPKCRILYKIDPKGTWY